MARYSIGIDLGTTHSAVSYLNLEEGKARGSAQSMLPIPQLVAPGSVEARQLLPSFYYLPAPEEFAAGSLSLPWDADRHDVEGELARSHGAKVPSRLVSSAKSWLSHTGVDRRSALLPWQAPPEVRRISPLEASSRYLRHLREAWDHAFPDEVRRLQSQEVVVTVPASFDPGARELTLEAAVRAGLGEVTLLEEPQAALYAWLEGAGEGFRKRVGVGELILVVDVGGGTSDFSLIAVEDRDGELHLTRVAVGDHILLGGDNMDLALAHALCAQLAEAGKTLDPFQFTALTHEARRAKELLFAESSGDTRVKKVPIAIAGRGSSLMGNTLRVELTRAQLQTLLTEGFFPQGDVTDLPQATRRTGLAQLNLPYAQDAAITRHLAAFLTRQAAAMKQLPSPPVRVEGSFLRPTAILFNGGVFKAQALKQRVLDTVNGWLSADGGPPVKELEGADLDLAVARGAAYYGFVKASGKGLRIRGGTARAYYVGVDSPTLAIPGMKPRVRALCVAPFGMEEGTQADVPPQEFGLLVGEPTQFRFFASSTRREDTVGDFVEDAEGMLEELAPIETTLGAQPSARGALVPVQLQAAVTELGSLELRCLEQNGKGRWKLELNVRMKE